ncbi:hypothetical protein BX070DRAFT_252091 [Coemansia spiralis]|nr:hypothetical protein BX070DRAFT_252091 [Coemansia spiralis]
MARTFGNPFETNILVKCAEDGDIIKSFFVHELPPNCDIHHLRERIAELGVPFDGDWVLVKLLPDESFVVLKDGKNLKDYLIECWDCIYIRPAHECHARPLNFMQRISKLGKLCFGIKSIESRYASAPVSPITADKPNNVLKRVSPSALNLQQYKERCLSSTSLFSTFSNENHNSAEARQLRIRTIV